MIRLDDHWLDRNPLPETEHRTNKNERGRVFVVGGSALVPGALRLTGEAALRAGAGKLQLGTVAESGTLLGMFVPEAAAVALPSTAGGELSADGVDVLLEHASACDALVLGPGMHGSKECERLVRAVIERLPGEVAVILDAGAIAAAATCKELLRDHAGAVILTPHPGEMASLSGLDVDQVQQDAWAIARRTADELQAIVCLKDARTIIAAPGGKEVEFDGGTPALATGGSGDVLAGIVGGLVARGAPPFVAAAWAVWTHGSAGSALARGYGGTGLLSRELLPLIPRFLNRQH
ncbi:NAD(P)H-hydrate dehydratase [Sphingomonas sp. ID1715]|uniref:NAD(P)H-hydrate dehydratase n=1 Tax=Sphingomonas sp. ID1715 TaxID=1656898 RepID=UPI0014885A0D|nr:NAD(P)H-hydrate dehydratase [Sphingomonas sp. ID1715]NNM76014.1 NAD(P)H-hydrate dehydratase [Sphingomonas sp. ID1715]